MPLHIRRKNFSSREFLASTRWDTAPTRAAPRLTETAESRYAHKKTIRWIQGDLSITLTTRRKAKLSSRLAHRHSYVYVIEIYKVNATTNKFVLLPFQFYALFYATVLSIYQELTEKFQKTTWNTHVTEGFSESRSSECWSMPELQ